MLLARIGGIQWKQEVGRESRYLARLEHTLQHDLSMVLHQEELVWFQRSRAKWLRVVIEIHDIIISKPLIVVDATPF